MTIEVFDSDVGSDDKVGEATVKLSALCVNNGIDDWFQIAYRGKSSGSVHLKSVWKPVGAGGQPGMQQQAQVNIAEPAFPQQGAPGGTAKEQPRLCPGPVEW